MDRPLLQGIDSIEIALALEPLQELDPLPAPEDCIADDSTFVEMEQIVDDNTDVEALWADGPDTVKQEYPYGDADGEQQGAFGDLPNGEQSRLIQRVRAEYVRR